MADYYDDLLKLCGWEDDEINKERQRIDKTFQKLGLGPEDMKRADSWVRQNHEVQLEGVRKLLGAWLKELVDLVLAKDEGKKIVYYTFPSIQGPGMAIKAAAPEAVYCSVPDVVLCHTLGQIFNKLTPILEAGEENGLPPGHAMCSLRQISVGALAEGIIPIPDMVMAPGYFCDLGSKVDELLHERYGYPAVYIDGAIDSRWGEYPDYLPKRVEFLGAELNKLFGLVKEILGVEVTSDAWDEAISTSRHLFRAMGRLTQLMTADPMPISAVETGLCQMLATASTGRAMTEGPEAVDILCQEVERRVDEGIGVVEKGAPRIINFVTHASDASVMHMMENAGLAMAAQLVTVPPPKAPNPTTYTTLGEVRAEWEMRVGLYHSSYGLIKRCGDSVEALKIDGVIWGYLFNCRPFALMSYIPKQWLEEVVGVPTLSLEMDIYDGRNYTASALRTRVETFAEMLRARKASAQGMKA